MVLCGSSPEYAHYGWLFHGARDHGVSCIGRILWFNLLTGLGALLIIVVNFEGEIASVYPEHYCERNHIDDVVYLPAKRIESVLIIATIFVLIPVKALFVWPPLDDEVIEAAVNGVREYEDN